MKNFDLNWWHETHWKKIICGQIEITINQTLSKKHANNQSMKYFDWFDELKGIETTQFFREINS